MINWMIPTKRMPVLGLFFLCYFIFFKIQAKNLEVLTIAQRAETFIDDAKPISWRKGNPLTSHQNPNIQQALDKDGVPLPDIGGVVGQQKLITSSYSELNKSATEIKELMEKITTYSDAEVTKHYVSSVQIISSITFLNTRLIQLEKEIRSLDVKIKHLSDNPLIRLLQRDRLRALNAQANNLKERIQQIRKNIPILDIGGTFTLHSDFLVYLFQAVLDVLNVGARHQLLIKEYENLNLLLKIYMFTRHGSH